MWLYCWSVERLLRISIGLGSHPKRFGYCRKLVQTLKLAEINSVMVSPA